MERIAEFLYDHTVSVIIAVFLLMCAFAVCVVASDHGKDGDGNDLPSFVYVKEIEGHRYILYNPSRGCCIVHSASCPCHDRAAPLQRPLQTVAKRKEELERGLKP